MYTEWFWAMLAMLFMTVSTLDKKESSEKEALRQFRTKE